MDADVRQRLLAATFSFARAQLFLDTNPDTSLFPKIFLRLDSTELLVRLPEPKFTIFRPTCRHVDEQNGVTTETAHFVEVSSTFARDLKFHLA